MTQVHVKRMATTFLVGGKKTMKPAAPFTPARQSLKQLVLRLMQKRINYGQSSFSVDKQ